MDCRADVYKRQVLLLWSVRIKEITITGSTRHTNEQMVNLLFPDTLDRNTLYCLYKEKFQPHKEITFVADYDIIFRSPFKVEVMVYEKKMCIRDSCRRRGGC